MLFLKPRQRLFAELVHQGITPKTAYAKAGYRWHNTNPYRTLRSEVVSKYLNKLEERAMKRHDITVEKILTDLEEARRIAKDQGQPAAMIAASMAEAKLVGLAPDKVELKNVDTAKTLDDLVQAVKTTLPTAEADTVLRVLGLNEEPKAWDAYPETSGAVN